jgi:predicted secreted protein
LKSILDPAFRYVPSIETDVRKTFDRIRREQREQSRTASNRGAGTNVWQLRAVTNGMSRASGEMAPVQSPECPQDDFAVAIRPRFGRYF